jgi:hypothetical protein
MHLSQLKDVIKDMIKEHGIRVTRKKFKSPVGRAWVQDRVIKIPRIVDFQSAGTAIHEIAHIILGHEDDVLDHICEYDTELWTIKFLKKCEMHIDYKAEFEIYVQGAKQNVQMHVDRYTKRLEKQGKQVKIKKKILTWLENESI